MAEAVGSSGGDADGDAEGAGGVSSAGGVWGDGGGDSAIGDANPIPDEVVEKLLTQAQQHAREAWNYNAWHALTKKEIALLTEGSIAAQSARKAAKVVHPCRAQGSVGGSANADSDGNSSVEVHGGCHDTLDNGTSYEFEGKVEVARDRDGHVTTKAGVGAELHF